MKPYPIYKTSNSAWLGDVPKHWETIKVKYLFKERVEKGFPDEPLLAATQTKGVVPKSMYENRTVEAQKDLHLLKLANIGDFVISLRSFQGGIEYTYYRGIISPAYTIMVPSTRIEKSYFKLLAKSKKFISLLKTCVTGIREGQNINYELLKRNFIPVPPLPEQQQIARYLDWKTAKINKFIKNKKKLVKLLKEQKQAIINDAVTGKIDVTTGKPFPEYKPSGIDWLGDIPVDWEVRRLGSIGTFSKGGNISRADLLESTEGINAILYGDIYTKYQYEAIEIKNHISQKTALSSTKLFKGDLLFTGSGETKEDIGKCVLFNSDKETYAGGDIIIFRQKSTNGKFLAYSQNSNYAQIQKMNFAKGEIIVHIYSSKLREIIMPYPQNLNEQQHIVSYIEKETALIDQTIEKAEKEIELIQEYRTRLISDAVTGQIDVRDIEVPDFEDVETEPEEEIEESEEEVLEDEVNLEEIEEEK